MLRHSYATEATSSVSWRKILLNSDFLQERLYVLSRRLDQQLVVGVLAYILSEEIESALNVGDRRFLRRELQSSFGQKRLHQRLNLVAEDLLRVSGNDEVIRVTTEVNPIGLGVIASRPGSDFPQPRFQSIWSQTSVP